MAQTINRSYVDTFERNVIHLAQQSDTRLERWVTPRHETSKSHNWDRLATNDPVEKVYVDANGVPTPNAETEWTRRQTQVKTYHSGELVQTESIKQMLIDPNSSHVQSIAMGMRRRTDRTIIEAATGTSRNGEGESVPFVAAQKIGGATTAFSYDLITHASEVFLQGNIDPSVPKCFVISPKMARKLFQMTEATSRDYNAAQTLSTSGYIDNWLGYTWIVSTLLNSPAAGQRDAFVMTSQAIGYHIAEPITADVAPDPSRSFDWRIYSATSHGAIRVEDSHLVHVHVLETA